MEVIPLLGHLYAWTWPSGFSGTLLTPDRPAAHVVSFGQVPVHPFLGRQKGSVLQNKAVMAKLAHCRRFWKSQVSGRCSGQTAAFHSLGTWKQVQIWLQKKWKYFLKIAFHITSRSTSSVPSLTDEETLKGFKKFIQDHTVNHQQANTSSHKKIRYLPRWD